MEWKDALSLIRTVAIAAQTVKSVGSFCYSAYKSCSGRPTTESTRNTEAIRGREEEDRRSFKSVLHDTLGRLTDVQLHQLHRELETLLSGMLSEKSSWTARPFSTGHPSQASAPLSYGTHQPVFAVWDPGNNFPYPIHRLPFGTVPSTDRGNWEVSEPPTTLRSDLKPSSSDSPTVPPTSRDGSSTAPKVTWTIDPVGLRPSSPATGSRVHSWYQVPGNRFLTLLYRPPDNHSIIPWQPWTSQVSFRPPYQPMPFLSDGEKMSAESRESDHRTNTVATMYNTSQPRYLLLQ